MGLSYSRKTQPTNGTRPSTSRSPIQRIINNDVLSAIFLETLNAHEPKDLRMTRIHPAVVVSHVCHRWREVALATKLLWRHLNIALPASLGCPCKHRDQRRSEGFQDQLKKLREAAQVWLSRSASCPIRLEINDLRIHVYGPQDSPGLANLIDLLCESSSRWESVAFRLHIPSPPDSCVGRILSAPPQTAPILTSAAMILSSGNPIGAAQQRLFSRPNILSAASLRSLVIGPETLVDDVTSLPVNWGGLERIEFGGYRPGSSRIFGTFEALQLLKLCPNLIQCRLVVQGETPTPAFLDTDKIKLPSLQELSLFTKGCHLPRSIALSLELPSLVKFTVSSGFCECRPRIARSAERSGLCDFFERFGSTLRDVKFSYEPLTQSAFTHSLRHLSNVTSLTLTNFSNHSDGAHIDGILKSLTLLCPKIEAISLMQAHDVRIDEAALLDFIEARRRRVVDSENSGALRLRDVNCNRYVFRAVDPMKELDRRRVDLVGFALRDYSHAITMSSNNT